MKKGKQIKIWTGAAVVLITVLGAVIYLVSRSKETEPEFVFTYAENQTEDYPTTLGAERFAELVEERTQGRIRIQVHAESVMGSESEVIKQMRYGGIDFARISIAQISDYVEEMSVLQLPYLYDDSDHMWRVLDGEIGERFLEYPCEYGLVGLSWYDAGARNIYCTTPIESLEDIKGLRIRVQEAEMMSDMITALDAQPVQIPYDRVYETLERKQVDGAENNWSSYETMRHYEVAKYFTVDEHIRIPEMQICSVHTWEQLSEQDRQVIIECARESALYERQLWTEHEERARETALANQVREIHLSDEELAKFRTAMAPIYERYYEDYGEVIEEIMKK